MNKTDRSSSLGKNDLRTYILQKRNTLGLSLQKKYSQEIVRRCLSYPRLLEAKNICLYSSFGSEVQTKGITKRLLELGKQLIFPKIRANNELSLYSISSLRDLHIGAYSYLEPDDTKTFFIASDIDIFLLPGIAFDRNGVRLGWGKGYYDRLLANTDSPRIGLAYDLQIVPYIPHESYDILMTAVITEQEIIEINTKS